MSDYDLGDGLKAAVNGRIAGQMAEEAVRHPVDDLERAAQAGEPPVPGAQWDELHRRWEHWDDAAQAWVVVGDDPGDAVAPEDENPLPPVLARANQLVEDEDAPPVVAPDRRQPEPDDAPPGAQWNEVVGRWERWDDATSTWVEATAANAPTD